jgi:hypothetical protein
MMISLATLILAVGADPTATLDQALEAARKADASLTAAWTAAEAAGWADGKKIEMLLAHGNAFSKSGDLPLAVARELIRRKRADDAWLLLDRIKPEQVSDAPTLHFHRGGVLQTLGRNDDAVRDFLALDGLPNVPERYAATAKALRAQLAALQRESLPGVAHDMREIERRLEIGRPDQRTQDLNKDVIARLDRLIDDLQKKANQAKRKSAASPSKPAEESRPHQGKSTGDVADGRQFRDTGKWGDLPEKERAKALQDLTRDFPAHYRDAVEEYFKKLSKESTEPRQ